MGLFRRKKKKNNTYDENLDLLFGEKIKETAGETLVQEQYMTNAEQRRQYVENWCEQIITCSKHIEGARAEYKHVTEYLKDVETIENLPDEYKEELIYYAKRVVVLENEKTGFKKYSSVIPERCLNVMKVREASMPRIIKTMAADEEFCENARTDLNNIEGEKLACKYDREDCITYINNVTKIGRAMLVALISIVAVLAYAIFVNGNDLELPLLIVTAIGSAIVMGAFMLNRNLFVRLKTAELKFNKLIGMENKIKLRYVNIRVKLDYEYKEYCVENAFELSKMYKMYLKAKKEQEVYERTVDTLYKSLNKYTEVLKKLDLNDYSIWISQPQAIIDPREMTEVRHMLVERRQSIRDSIDYNNTLIERAKKKIKDLTTNNKEHAEEILKIVSEYEMQMEN